MPGKKQIGDFVFPTIPEGAATTIIPVPFPVTSASPTSATSSSSKAVQELQIVAVFVWQYLFGHSLLYASNASFVAGASPDGYHED